MKEIMNNPVISQQLIIFALLLFAMWFLIMRPQKKKEKEINSMRNSLKQGDEIITIGGIYGKIMKVKDESVIIQVGVDKVKFEITKWAVSKVISSSADNSKQKEIVEEPKKKSLPKKLLKKDESSESSEEIKEESKTEA
ncbi:MAG: preprotein translocase subunit YajC [Eubacteriales bacterium]